jgi:hypothetical protein
VTGDCPTRGADCAHDLHDSVIQRLFGAGLALQSTLVCIADPAARERVRQSVGVLDEIIDEVRSVLHAGQAGAAGGLPHRLPGPGEVLGRPGPSGRVAPGDTAV